VIVDGSAVIAILLQEPGYEPLLDRVTAPGSVAIGAPTLAETGLVLTARLGIPGQTLLARFVSESRMAVLPFTDEHWPVAIDAFRRFGKGRHPAALNVGDCLTYAVARLAGEALLCAGQDFPKTDLPLAI